MLKIKGHEEFAKWWTYWIAKIDRSRAPSPSGEKTSAERFVDGDRNNPTTERADA